MLHQICQEWNENELSTVSKLWEFNINATDDLGSTPIHIALKARNTSSAIFLIKEGVDINIENQYGLTPLQLALDAGFVEIVSLLLVHGVNTSCLQLDKICDLLNDSHNLSEPSGISLSGDWSNHRQEARLVDLMGGMSQPFPGNWMSRSIVLLK